MNSGTTNRNNGRVTVEAKIQVRIILEFEILSFFRNNFAMMNRIIVSINTVNIQAIQNFTSLLSFTNSIHSSLSIISNV